MKATQKKIVSALLIVILLIIGAVVVTKGGLWAANTQAVEVTEQSTEQEDAYAKAKADLTFWYEDDTYTTFFEEAARVYFAQTGVKVVAECKDTIDYIGDIYDKTMQDDGFPDVSLISGADLEEAYLYGLVSVNDRTGDREDILLPARNAAIYDGKVLGYPLSYNTCVFVYQNGYFESTPESLQMIIDYSNENEPAENVEYLLEWNVNDGFYDFPFVSNSVTFDKSEKQSMNVVYDQTLYDQDIAFFESILESFSIDASHVTEEGIIDHFMSGKTLCAIIDTDCLYQLEGYSYSMIPIPNLNDELTASTTASTDMMVVNAFSQKEEQAKDFAAFVTTDMSGVLQEQSGHYSVIPSENPDAAETLAIDTYNNAVPMPNSMDARDFWVKLEETISKYF